MPAAQPRSSGGRDSGFHPSAWLIVPTVSLLAGQALAVAPWAISPFSGAGLLLPWCCVFSPRWRRWALLVCLAALTFALGYGRHRQLLYPEFSENHLRSVMTQEARLYLEGTLRHEPENSRTAAVGRFARSGSGNRPGRKKSPATFCSACAPCAVSGVTATECGFGFALRSRKTAAIRVASTMRLTWRSGISTPSAFSTATKKSNYWRANLVRLGILSKVFGAKSAFSSIAAFPKLRRIAQGAGVGDMGASPKRRARRLLRPESIMCYRFPACMSPCSVWWCSA